MCWFRHRRGGGACIRVLLGWDRADRLLAEGRGPVESNPATVVVPTRMRALATLQRIVGVFETALVSNGHPIPPAAKRKCSRTLRSTTRKAGHRRKPSRNIIRSIAIKQKKNTQKTPRVLCTV